jgi:hypothetical protein
MQHALAVGRGIAALMARGEWGTIDCSPLSPQSLLSGQPIVERNVI